MKTRNNKSFKRVSLFFLAILSPILTFADGKWGASEQTPTSNSSIYAEIAIGIVFVGAVVTFLVWKSKHDKKEREKQMERMKKIQAAKRRAS